MSNKIALVVGHKESRPGAINRELHLTEFDFNKPLVEAISRRLSNTNSNNDIVERIAIKGNFLSVTTGSSIYMFNVRKSNNIILYDADSNNDHEGTPHEIIFRDSYRGLPHKIGQIDPSFSISFHCNAFNGKARGCETLYYYKCEKSKEIANYICKEITNSFQFLRNRGAKAIDAEDRGGYLLQTLHYKYDIPAVIFEPFFIDNTEELMNILKVLPSFINKISDIITHIHREML